MNKFRFISILLCGFGVGFGWLVYTQGLMTVLTVAATIFGLLLGAVLVLFIIITTITGLIWAFNG